MLNYKVLLKLIVLNCVFICCVGTVHDDTILKYRVIRNDCRGFNNLSYTIHLQ